MKKNWKVVVLFVTALAIAKVGANAITSYTAASAGRAMQVYVSSQDSNGLTLRDFNADFLRSLEAHISQDTKQKRDELIRRQGLGLPKMEAELNQVSSQAVYVQGDKKLAVIRLQAPNWNSVVVVGLLNEKLTRVACEHSSVEMIAVSYGLCGEKIDEVFGMTLGNSFDALAD